MPNDYIDQVKLTDNTVVDIKDTVSGYSKVFEIHATAITGTDYYTLDKSWSDISSAISNGDNLIISNIDATYPYTTINNSGIVFGATLIATDSGSTFALTDGILVINNQGTAMGMALHMNTTIPTIPSSSAILKGDGSGGVTAATAGTDYMTPANVSDNYVPLSKSSGGSVVTITDSPLLNSNTFSIEAANGSYTSKLRLYVDPNTGAQSAYLKAGSNTLTVSNTSTTIKNVTTPSADGDAANKKYVDDSIGALDGGTIGTGSTTKTITSLSQTNGNVSATFNDIAFPVTSVNTQTGAVSLTASDVGAQATLVSGTNIKTINNESVLGSGNISISGGTPEVFTATYGSTTYADVTAAVTAGKIVFATRTDSGVTRYLPLIEKNGGGQYIFSGEYEKAETYYSLGTDSTWAQITYNLAGLSSPLFTGTPKAPTAATGTDTTQIATTAFVQGEIDSITPDDISAAPLYTGPYLNAGTASYRIFGHATVNTGTQASPFQFLVGCLSSMTGQNQGLYLVEGSNRSSSVSIRVTALRKTGASNFTFGYYISNGEYYLGVYTSTTYANSPKILVLQNSSRCPWTFDDSIAASSTAPSGWTTISSDALATTDDINTAKPFIATYGTTSYSDITTALSADRAVYCHYVSGDDDIILPYVCTTEAGIYVFTNMVGSTCWRFYINSSGTWSNGKTALAATQTTASLAVASWSNNSITVTVSGVTTSNLVIVSPAPTSAKTWAACGVICTTQAANKLTFTCESTPTTALTANIAVWA